MGTRILIDSTTDLPQDFFEENNMTMFPLFVVIDGKEYIDRETISTEEVYNHMRAGLLPKTAQIDLQRSENTMRGLLLEGEDLLYIGFSSKMSGTYQAIWSIMNDLREEFPDRKMVALDSRGGSFATGLISMEAAKLATAGVAFEDIVERTQFLIDHVEHVFVITDLTWMIRGGRISRTLGYTANLLNIKPVLDVADGEMEVIHKIRGRKQSMKKVAEIVAERARKCPKQLIAITHADDIKAANEMRDMISLLLPEASFAIEQIGPVLGVHIGIGGVGVFFFNEM